MNLYWIFVTHKPHSMSQLATPLPYPQRVDVSIVVVTWNSDRWIGRCLAALPEACAGLEHEVIVFDNASGDETRKIVRDAAGEAIRLVPSAFNRGFAGGVNGALKRARGRYIFLLNPDCELGAGSVTRLVEHLETHGEAAAAAPLLLDVDGTPQREFQLRRFPRFSSIAAETLLLSKIAPGNRASARGAFGAPGDKLAVRFDVPRLELIDERARGRVQGTADVTGT